jgi:signal transduction histidine kinase
VSRIFDAFAQAEPWRTRRFGGLGLGLTISKALVEMHGGTITVQSEGGDRGATFTVRLPVLAAP